MVTLGQMCYGIVVDADENVIDTAPTGRWAIGNNLSAVTRWAEHKGGSVRFVKEVKPDAGRDS